MLKNQVAFVTGASSGIGEAAAWKLLEEGCRVAMVARGGDKLMKMESEMNRTYKDCALACIGDVASDQDMAAAVQRTMQKWQRIDIVFANAGINGTWTAIDDMKLDEWKQVIDINLTGTYLTIHHTVPVLKTQNSGCIIICSSINGNRQFVGGRAAYSASKAGQSAMGKVLAIELAKHNIRVNVIEPGVVDTAIEDKTEERMKEETHEKMVLPELKRRVPITRGEAGKPEDVAHLVAFLASRRASLISGTQVVIDGAGSLLA